MLFGMSSTKDFSVPLLRRKELLSAIKTQYPHVKKGAVLLLAGFEQERVVFRQESSFYYFTGITEPSVAVLMDLDGGQTTLFIPNCSIDRSRWMYSPIQLVQENASAMGFHEIVPLGKQCAGFQLYPYFSQEEYADLLLQLKELVEQQGTLFTFVPNNAHEYVEQRLILDRIATFIPQFPSMLVDISVITNQMRRHKDMQEIEMMYKAAEITTLAHEAASQEIRPGVSECEVQASIEYIFVGSCARPAFPSIVAGGHNGTVLHYTVNKDVLKAGDLVVVDIGAEYNYYSADITRTYPVSGTFTQRQRELYNIVLDTQEYIASLAKPGYWLSNKDEPERSLNHLARKYLQERGYDRYFIHGIGHFLGLDVHDVGDYTHPLQEGDVITIEPGIYIPEEHIGIRIEDDYWVVKDGVVCLSEYLPKKIEDIEAMMQQNTDYQEPFNGEEAES
jgi:Xaa-Pro aminopeptidase